MLKEKLDKKRIMLNDDQRRRLAVKGKVLGRKTLSAIASIVTPDTILRWHRQLRPSMTTAIDVWTKGGLVTFYLLFTMNIKSRRVHFAGCTQSRRNLDETGCQRC